jgi:divalent metal cation (Fe/Co/Zn/Cd) transporter
MEQSSMDIMDRSGSKSVGELKHNRWMRIATRLVIATLIYNVAEAVVSLWAAIQAGSVALLGFGFDSLIEVAAAIVLMWRFRVEARGAAPERIERVEHKAHRFIGTTFIVLAIYVTAQSTWTLWMKDAPRESLVGIVLAAISLTLMPLVSLGKLRAAREIGSASLRAEAKETLACSYLSFTLLIGLVANATLGWWWADPIAALLMVPWLVQEGREGLSGQECCSD